MGGSQQQAEQIECDIVPHDREGISSLVTINRRDLQIRNSAVFWGCLFLRDSARQSTADNSVVGRTIMRATRLMGEAMSCRSRVSSYSVQDLLEQSLRVAHCTILVIVVSRWRMQSSPHSLTSEIGAAGKSGVEQ